MSILNVEHLSHGFGDRAIFEDVSFRLLKGEHIGLVGANGEGKSTFMNIVTRKLQPDEGKVEWSKNVQVGYLDQHTVLEPGMTIQDVLRGAFSYLFELEAQMNQICEKLGEVGEEEMNQLLEELGTIQDTLTLHDFYVIDAKVEEVARALGLMALGLEHDVADLSGGQRTKVLLAKLLLSKPDILLLDEPTNYLDEEHIVWLKRYLLEYENAFVLISHDIPFLNEVVNLIYHMENKKLNRYVGNYDHFQEVYAVQKSQLEAAYKRQQQEITELKEFVNRNKARVATRNMAMSRQKKLDKMERIELAAEKPKPEFNFKEARAAGKYIFETEDLVIGYDDPLSKPLNLAMARGDKIALVGATGSGKTTVVNLLMRFYPVDAGEILIDGVNIQDIKRDELRKNIAIVLQDTVLFSDTIENNIKYSNPDASDEEMYYAAEMSNLKHYIERLPKKYQTFLKQAGAGLSHGQRQLLAIARAVLANPKILILDEATSSVDTRTEKNIQDAMVKLMKNRTNLIIAHRLSTIRDADKIVVMDQGRVVEIGNHEELLAKKGRYYALYMTQFAGNKI